MNTEAQKPHVTLRCARAAVFIFLAIFSGLFIYCVTFRLTYPFELEWIEGEMVCHGLRLAEWQPIYAAPSTSFVAEIYPPVYYLLTALLYRLFDTINFTIPRIISLLSCLGILILLYRIAIKEGGDKSIGLLTCGFFLSFYEIHGTWYDLARVDMLLFVFLLAGCYVLAYGTRTTFSTIFSALLLVLACYTKQSGLCFLPCAALYLFFKDRQQSFIFTGVVSLLLLSVFFILQYASDGWFGTYVLFNPLGHKQLVTKPLSELQFRLLFEMRDKLITEMRYEIFYKLPIFFTMVLAFLVHRLVALTRSTHFTIWEWTAVGAVVSYFSIRPYPGSERNDFIYLTLWGCILLGLLLIKLKKAVTDDTRQSTQTVVYLLLALQLCLQLYNPKPLIPNKEDIKKGAEFIAMVGDLPGEVYIPYHSFYAVMAGKKMIFNGGAYWAYQILAKERFKPEELMDKIRKQAFSAIIIDGLGYLCAKGEPVPVDNVKLLLTSGDELSQVVAEHYTIAGKIPYSTDNEFRNVAGFRIRPEIILKPKSSPP